jgi:hypothetical protein
MNAHSQIPSPDPDSARIGLDDDLLEGAEAIAKAMGPKWTRRRVYHLSEDIAAGVSNAPIRNIGGKLTSSRILLNRWRRRQLDPDGQLA